MGTSTLDQLWESLKANPLIFEIAGHPPSVNQIWRGVGRRIYKIPEAAAFESMVGASAHAWARRNYGTSDLRCFKGRPLELHLSFGRPSWKAKAKKGCEGHIIRPDVSNLVKCAEDGLMRALGLDDSAVMELSAKKISGAVRTVFELRFL